MKKFIALFLAAMLAFGGAALAEQQTNGNGLNYIKEKGTFILGLDDSFPPMGYRNEDNEIVGFDIDVAKEVCARLNVELILQPVQWSAKELELESKNIDCIWNGMSITDERKEGMALSQAYLNNQIVMIVADETYTNKEALAGKDIGTQGGSFAEEVLTTYEDYAAYYESLGEVYAYDDYLTAMMDLANGNIAGVLIDLVVANYLIASESFDKEFYVADVFEDDLYAIGFRKDEADLRDAVDAILDEMAADGKLAEISAEWFGSDITVVGQEEKAAE